MTPSTEDPLAEEGVWVEKRRQAYFTYSPEHGGAYYFAPTLRMEPPYKEQREVTAFLDIADDGTLAGVELVLGELPNPPSRHKNYLPEWEGQPTELERELTAALRLARKTIDLASTRAWGRTEKDHLDAILTKATERGL